VIVELVATEVAGVCSLLDGRYSVRFDGLARRYRWALTSRPDDGLGIQTHGARTTLQAAVQDCIDNDKERRAR